MVESSVDSTQKRGLESNSGDVYPALARTACAEPLRPFKRNPSSLPQAPFSIPLLDLTSSPSRDESHLLSSLSSPYVPFISRLRLLLDKPSASPELARENSWKKRRARASAGYPIGPGCPLGLMLCLIRMLCHPKSPAAHPDQACNQPDIDTSRQTLGLDEALIQARGCGS